MAKRSGIMLAHPAEDKRIRALGEDFLVQPKLNGVRARIKGDSKNNILVSSSGAEKKFMEHIHDQLNEMPFRQWDGELYVHGWPWERINSVCSRTVNRHPDAGKMEFHIFDYSYEQIPMKSRGWSMEGAARIIEKESLHSLKIVPTYWATQQTWGAHLDTFLYMKYEGIMFRHAEMPYEEKRSAGLLKFKPRKTDIYKIKRVIQGDGWCHDRLGSFVVEDKHGNEFGVGTGACLTAPGRLKYWKIKDQLPGQYLLVKHEELKTINDLPKCVVAVQVLTHDELKKYKEHEDLN